MPDALETWSGSLHQSFRIHPEPSSNLEPFLNADGKTPEEVLATLPYDRSRVGTENSAGPDMRRYRDGRLVYQTAGLLYEDDEGHVHVTPLGAATLRFLPKINDKNKSLLGRHAAYALAACQLQNPTRAGRKYAGVMEVFPFAFIWRAMFALDGRISSDELNRSLFKVRNAEELKSAITNIRTARAAEDVTLLGDEVITGAGKNDRIIPWVSLASFGWTLFPDKRGAEDGRYYELEPSTKSILEEASRVVHRHRDFATAEQYFEHVARCASLPRDLR